MIPVGVWLRPDDFTRAGLRENFIEIVGKKDDLYKCRIYWDWEDKKFLDEPYDDWKYEEEINTWDVYQPEDLIISLFVEGVK